MAIKVFIKNNYLTVDIPGDDDHLSDHKSKVFINKTNVADEYLISSPKIGDRKVLLTDLVDINDVAFNLTTWTDFYTANTGFDDASVIGAQVKINTLDITNLQDNQVTGVVTYSTLALLPVTGVLLTSYKVTNDPNPINIGYYHWSGSIYIKDGNTDDGIVGNKVIENLFKNNRYPQETLVNTYNALTLTNPEAWEVYSYLDSYSFTDASSIFGYQGNMLTMNFNGTANNCFFRLPSKQIINDSKFKIDKAINFKIEINSPISTTLRWRIYETIGGVSTQISIVNLPIIIGVNIVDLRAISNGNFTSPDLDYFQFRFFDNIGNLPNSSFDFGRMAIYSGDSRVGIIDGYDFISNEDINYQHPRLQNKKLVTLGDSITVQNTWQPEIVRRVGVSYNKDESKLGLNGSPAMGVGGSTFTPFINNTTGKFAGDSIYFRADFTDDYNPDLVIIAGGQNDPFDNIGSINDVPYTGAEVTSNPPTFYASVMGTVEKVFANNPAVEILLIAPAYSTDQTYAQKKLKCDAIVEVGKLYGIKTINLLEEAGINSINHAQFLSDGVHPNQIGGTMEGGIIANKII
jgi:hypothetical protein